MKIEIYKTQREVFILGVLALFPEKLEGHIFSADCGGIYKYLFTSRSNDHLFEELMEYQEKGYFRFEEKTDVELGIDCMGRCTIVPFGYHISGVNSQKATDDLIEYLKKWELGDLTTGEATKPADFLHQQDIFFSALAGAYGKNKKPIIKWSDLYGEVFSYRDHTLPPFWELLFWNQLVDSRLAITKMDYGKAKSKENHKLYKQPFAELIIKDQALLQRVTQALDPEKPVDYNARVLMEGRLVCVEIRGDKTYTIAKLDDGGSLYLFMQYLLSSDNFNMDLKIEDIRGIKGCASLKTLTEPVRYCGFNKVLKSAFFPVMKKDRIHFKNTALLDTMQINALKKQAVKIVNKS